MKRTEKKLQKLRETWERPEKFKLTLTEERVIKELEEFMNKIPAYKGKIICGKHGIGKSFVMRRFLLDKGKLSQSYVNVNDRILGELKDVKRKKLIFNAVSKLLKSFREYEVVVLDSCEVLDLLPPQYFNPIVEQVYYSSEAYVFLVLPSETRSRLVELNYKISDFSPPSERDFEIFFENLRIPTPDILVSDTFTSEIKRWLENG